MHKIKVVIIDQSISVSKKLTTLVSNHDNITVVGTATNLDEGIHLISTAFPHVVLLDVNIEGNNNKTALETILAKKPIAIIMLSENTVQQTAKTVHALSNGAVDFIKKLNGKQQVNEQHFEREVIAKIIHANNINTSRQLANKDSKPIVENIKPIEKRSVPERKLKDKKNQTLISIGTSTGGPRALHRIIESLPKNFPAPILIVQHMPAKFTKSLALRLNNVSNIRVKEATHGEIIEAGTAYIAPGNYHMLVKEDNKGIKIILNQEPEYLGHRPSVNVLFNSVANLNHLQKIAVILTGMGKDGAEGALNISHSADDAVIIAESKETAVIDGMPNAAIESNCVTEILKLNDIAQALVDYVK